MRTTEKQLNDLVKDICDLTGLANNKTKAIELGHDKYLAIENNPCYRGWRFICIQVNNGAHYGAFGENATEPRLKASEMATKLKGIKAGLMHAYYDVKNPINK